MTVTSPISSTSILSNPWGPSDDLTMLAIALTAMAMGVVREGREVGTVLVPDVLALLTFSCDTDV